MNKSMPMHEEPIRRMLAQAIQHHLVTGTGRPELPERPEEVESVTGFSIGPSEVRLRVRMKNNTYRTFTVSIRENR